MRGKKRHNDRPIKRNLTIPESLDKRVEAALFDPLRKKRVYGGYTALITQLLKAWLRGDVTVVTLQPTPGAVPFCPECLEDLPKDVIACPNCSGVEECQTKKSEP